MQHGSYPAEIRNVVPSSLLSKLKRRTRRRSYVHSGSVACFNYDYIPCHQNTAFLPRGMNMTYPSSQQYFVCVSYVLVPNGTRACLLLYTPQRVTIARPRQLNSTATAVRLPGDTTASRLWYGLFVSEVWTRCPLCIESDKEEKGSAKTHRQGAWELRGEGGGG